MGDNSDYKELIKEVEIVDKNAAEYLRTDAKQLEGFIASRFIDFCFDYPLTPQGKEYWINIERLINKYKMTLFCMHNIKGYSCSVCKDDPKYKLTGLLPIKGKEDSKDEIEIKILINKGNNFIYEKDGIKFKRCFKCEKEKELNRNNFIPNSMTNGGYENQCRKCKNIYFNEHYKNKKKNSAVIEKINKIKTEVKENTELIQLKEIIQLDFRNHSEIYEKLKKQAEKEFRTIENQIMWYLSLSFEIE